MNYSLASRYSRIFKLMGNPYTLIILDHLFENRKPMTLEELVVVSKTTKGTVQSICEELYDLTIVDRDYAGETTTYTALDTSYANYIEKMIEYID